MADTVKLRNIGDQDLHVAQLDGRLVEKDCLVEIPAKLLHHQRACTGTGRVFVPDKGTWEDQDCPGCLEWPQATWKVETASKAKG